MCFGFRFNLIHQQHTRPLSDLQVQLMAWNNSRQVSSTPMPLSPSSIIWWWQKLRGKWASVGVLQFWLVSSLVRAVELGISTTRQALGSVFTPLHLGPKINERDMKQRSADLDLPNQRTAQLRSISVPHIRAFSRGKQQNNNAKIVYRGFVPQEFAKQQVHFLYFPERTEIEQ